MKNMILLAFILPALFLAGCLKLKHEMTVQPIHVTVEIRVKIDRELEDFFSDIDNLPPSSEQEKAGEKSKDKEDKK